ncbi:DUF418 domain-containing protein [Maritalea mediterranea]|uniref:DUF418 domain-containing protein n=1 Tax=Maritalea mediterranea TaxID=2909667 RepID=A0ABS9E7B4_9HYPH|nr:DUF418 domain-containing protein [Maritalea mediterranea]MCF4097323.1 DUF418 domain-containing protein [Maritalea mediterranea]
MTRPDRALMPDYLRLFALFGIVIVNVQFIAFSVLDGFALPEDIATTDAVTLWLVNGLALLKSYSLFSFMFGVGLGFLLQSAARRHLSFGHIYRNRMLGLLLLGVLHGCLLFPGDILVVYAITGSILYLFKDWSVRRLVKTGVILLVLQLFLAVPAFLATPETPADIVLLERQIMTEGGFIDAVIFRVIGFAITLPIVLVAQGTSALGWFCLGLAAVKSGMIDKADHPLWQRARRFCLIPGVGLSLLGAGLWQWGPEDIGMILTIFAAPISTIGYLGLIAALSTRPGPIMTRLLTAGSSSLSVYLGQSIVLSTIFSSYGLGLWSQVDPLTATLIAIAVTLVLIIALTLWRARFKLGPFEWVLRGITYAGTQKNIAEEQKS